MWSVHVFVLPCPLTGPYSRLQRCSLSWPQQTRWHKANCHFKTQTGIRCFIIHLGRGGDTYKNLMMLKTAWCCLWQHEYGAMKSLVWCRGCNMTTWMCILLRGDGDISMSGYFIKWWLWWLCAYFIMWWWWRQQECVFHHVVVVVTAWVCISSRDGGGNCMSVFHHVTGMITECVFHQVVVIVTACVFLHVVVTTTAWVCIYLMVAGPQRDGGNTRQGWISGFVQNSYSCIFVISFLKFRPCSMPDLAFDDFF